jgi:lipopolysaccharide/colanic/teichoic acid biosynthesis glycosyltransferase
VSGRNALKWEDRRMLDREYLARMSFWQDLAILARTIPSVVGARGIFAGGGRQADDASSQR